MSVIFAAFIAFLSWGSGDVFLTFASRKIGPFNASFYGYFFAMILSSFYIPFAFNQLRLLNYSLLFLIILLSVIQLVAFLAYNQGLKVGNPSLVGTIAGAFTSLVVILSILFFGERPTSQEILAIILTFTGLFLSSINFSDIKNKKAIINKGTGLALITLVCWAIYFTFIKIPVQKAGVFWPTYITSIINTIVFLIFGLKKIKLPKLGYKSGFLTIFVSSALLTLGSFCFNYAVGTGSSSVVAPISGAYPALFALIAYFIFKDPITNQQKAGIITTLVGIIALAYFGS